MTDAGAADPPADLRARIVTRARSVRPPGRALGLGDLPSGADLYRAMSTQLGQVLGGLDADGWAATVAPYGWTVQGLIAHVSAIDRYTVEVHRRGAIPSRAEHDHLAMTLDAVAAADRRAPSVTAADWRDAAGEVASLPGGDATVSFHGSTLDSEAVLVIRAFEVWTHTDDVRRALGRPPVDPEPEQIRRMSEHSLALAVRSNDPPVRLVLTGSGGGTWQLGRPAPVGDEDALIVLDAVDYCRFAARRLDSDELEVAVEGARAPVERFLEVVRSMAV